MNVPILALDQFRWQGPARRGIESGHPQGTSHPEVFVEEASGRPTLDSVARQAGVSRQTVSNVLNSPHLVRPETLERVRQVISDLGYRPNLAARRMRTRRSHLIALRMEPIRDGINGVVLDRFLHALTESAQSRGYQVLLFTAADDGDEIRSYEQLTATHAIDAFVLASTHHGDRRTEWLTERGLSFVTFGRPWGGEDAHDWVDVDGSQGTRDAVAHLVGLGHRRIGFVGWPAGSGVGDDRRAGWSSGLAAAGLDVGNADIARLDVAVPDGIDSGSSGAAQLLDDADPPTAFVCASDSLALGVVGQVRARGLVPGEDVAVVGFDDTVVAHGVGLSSVAQPIDLVAGECVRLLSEQLEARHPHPLRSSRRPDVRDHCVLLAPHLVVRASSHRSVGQNPPRSATRPEPRQGATP